ncbi:g349 [Yersinia phage phiR1-37]|uniref:hypothetical protein n=1 Tax=Yersinia phage phiR1-37 TaxID=331278 RepID=UPI00022DBE08|nr:hypothetical protein phiR1-37_gp349 [Yersinia phage phiR1-37]CCE26372.1 g349 [Yersinia phage phiR1-37]
MKIRQIDYSKMEDIRSNRIKKLHTPYEFSKFFNTYRMACALKSSSIRTKPNYLSPLFENNFFFQSPKPTFDSLLEVGDHNGTRFFLTLKE